MSQETPKNTYVTLHKNFVRTDIEHTDRRTGETRTFNSVTLPKGTVIDGHDVSYYQFSPLFVNESRYRGEDYRDIPLLTNREVWLRRSILDKDGKPVPDGEAGEICVRGSGLASGYFGNWEKTTECFIQNPTNPYFRDILYRTGDIAVKKDDGLLYFLSRQDGQIKHMGYRIELGEIETALHSVDGIAAAACLFDRNRDRIVCIYEGEPDAAALARAMRRLVPKYMLPNIYEKLDALPMNANGKIDRVKLKEQFIHAED